MIQELVAVNYEILQSDQIVTSLMILIRVGYFIPNSVARIYCHLRETGTWFTKARGQHLVSTSGINEVSTWDYLTSSPYLLDYSTVSIFRLKNLLLRHPVFTLILIMLYTIGISCSYAVFQQVENAEVYNSLQIRATSFDIFSISLFQVSSQLFRQ